MAPSNTRVVLLTGAYLACALAVWDAMGRAAPGPVVDEQFHLAQARAYCSGRWGHWEPKLTTPPGLYLLAALAAPALGCELRGLRMLSVLLSALCLVLLTRRGAARLALLPPLALCVQLFYSDGAALALLLLALALARRGAALSAALLATGAVLVRQTNVVWLGFYFARRFLDCSFAAYRGGPGPHPMYSLGDCIAALIFHLKTGFKFFFRNTSAGDLRVMFSLLSVMFGFVMFVFINGSIVLGDKSAHEASIHLPQILYFCLFYTAFSLPQLISSMREDSAALLRSPFTVVLQAAVILLVVHYNTLEHPYLLADNRHYTFYAWRVYTRWWWVRYACVPLFVYAIRVVWSAARRAGTGFLLPYGLCLVASLVPQRLLEPRYFLVPFLLLRLEHSASSAVAVGETLLYLSINALTLYIFLTKEIRWVDYDDVQRLIW